MDAGVGSGEGFSAHKQPTVGHNAIFCRERRGINGAVMQFQFHGGDREVSGCRW